MSERVSQLGGTVLNPTHTHTHTLTHTHTHTYTCTCKIHTHTHTHTPYTLITHFSNIHSSHTHSSHNPYTPLKRTHHTLLSDLEKSVRERGPSATVHLTHTHTHTHTHLHTHFCPIVA